ncbi:MAG: C40 family peptidase [Siphonobacter sp.]
MKYLLTLGLLLTIHSAFTQNNPMNEVITSIQKKYAPDKRTAIFEVALSPDGHLTGKTNLPEAHQELLDHLNGQTITDEIRNLPDASLGEKTQAIVSVSVCNIRTAPKHSAELATQALLGTPLTVYELDNGWYRVQTPDQYIAWVDQGAIHLVTPAKAENWQKVRKLIYLSPYGFSYSEPNTESQTVSDLVAGNLVEYKGERKDFYEVAYPDGRKAFIRKRDTRFYNEWLASLKISENSLVSTSKRLMGLPYLWGGTSFKGVDCSGFTKTVYFLNGVVLPRDASQQVHSGELVDETKQWQNLHPGDLLFFGKKNDDGSEKVVHVAMWIGNNQFIHSSNYVQIGSVDPKAENYDDYNVNRYLRSKRVLNNYQNTLRLSPQ